MGRLTLLRSSKIPSSHFPCALSIYIKKWMSRLPLRSTHFSIAPTELCWQTAATTLRRLATPQLCRRFRASPTTSNFAGRFLNDSTIGFKVLTLGATNLSNFKDISKTMPIGCRQTVHLHTLGARCFAENSFGGSLLGPASDFLLGYWVEKARVAAPAEVQFDCPVRTKQAPQVVSAALWLKLANKFYADQHFDMYQEPPRKAKANTRSYL